MSSNANDEPKENPQEGDQAKDEPKENSQEGDQANKGTQQQQNSNEEEEIQKYLNKAKQIQNDYKPEKDKFKKSQLRSDRLKNSKIQEAKDNIQQINVEKLNADYLNRVLVLGEMCLMYEDLLNERENVKYPTLLGQAYHELYPKAQNYEQFAKILDDYDYGQIHSNSAFLENLSTLQQKMTIFDNLAVKLLHIKQNFSKNLFDKIKADQEAGKTGIELVSNSENDDIISLLNQKLQDDDLSEYSYDEYLFYILEEFIDNQKDSENDDTDEDFDD